MAVDLAIANHIATITLNRPEAMNALDPETIAALNGLCDQLNADPDVRVIILTGQGERAFCTGADLKKTVPTGDSAKDMAILGDAMGNSYREKMTAGKPIICAINGYALGGGLELALACDIRIAASHARFGLPEVRIGSLPGGGGTQRLPRSIGRSDALLLMLTGDQIDALEALRIGLVSRVVAVDELLNEARRIAERIVANGPLAVRAVKRLVHEGADMPLSAALAAEQREFKLLMNTEDRVEGRKAFSEKRAPQFQGR